MVEKYRFVLFAGARGFLCMAVVVSEWRNMERVGEWSNVECWTEEKSNVEREEMSNVERRKSNGGNVERLKPNGMERS